MLKVGSLPSSFFYPLLGFISLDFVELSGVFNRLVAASPAKPRFGRALLTTHQPPHGLLSTERDKACLKKKGKKCCPFLSLCVPFCHFNQAATSHQPPLATIRLWALDFRLWTVFIMSKNCSHFATIPEPCPIFCSKVCHNSFSARTQRFCRFQIPGKTCIWKPHRFR